MKHHLLLALLATMGLAACGPTPAPKPTAAPAAMPPTSFGPWQGYGCQLGVRTADLWLTTTGRVNTSSQLELRLHVTPVLVRPPMPQLLGFPSPVRLEGSTRTYTLWLPYTPEAGAHLLQETSVLRLTYQPLGTPNLHEVDLPTKPLMAGLAALPRSCP